MINQQTINQPMENFYENTVQPRPPPLSAKNPVVRSFLLHRTNWAIGESTRPETAFARNRVDRRGRNPGGLSAVDSISIDRSLTDDANRHQCPLQPARRGCSGMVVRR